MTAILDHTRTGLPMTASSPLRPEFDNSGTKEFEVVIKGVASVKERVFKY